MNFNLKTGMIFLNEKRDNKNDIRNGNIKGKEIEEAMTNYHTERIAYLIEEQKWKEPILIIKELDPKKEYIDGRHRIWAAKCAGVKEIEAIAVDISEQD